MCHAPYTNADRNTNYRGGKSPRQTAICVGCKFYASIHEPTFQDYAFQLFTSRPILRWDNAPHYPDIKTAPYHFHNENEQIEASPLTGNPAEDLQSVLQEIERFLTSE